MVNIILNGKKVLAKEGQTVLEVAREQGYSIPTLCHDEDLKPYGSCFVCAVKVEGRRGFVTSCCTEVNEGMVIDTESESVRKARKMALELLVSDHYADCEAPCKEACPAHADVQSYVSLIANKQYHEAIKVIKDKIPMPLSVGRVCPAFCEAECRRQIVDEPIAIRHLKRFAADYDMHDYWQYVPTPELGKNKKVAIIGGGPSGLTCGYYLTCKGYDVKIYESNPKAGGWLRYGIPEYRLPKDILDAEIEIMCLNGLEIECNVEIGKDISFEKIYEDYDAIYIAVGASKAMPMKISGSNLEGSYLGVDFLKANINGKAPKLGSRCAVIGGGNTAIDCVRTVQRLGAQAILVYRRSKEQMPAEVYEIEAAEHEGVEFKLLYNPVEYLSNDNGRIKAMKVERMVLGEPDASGRRSPQGTGEFETIEVDSVIAAISQKTDVEFLKNTEIELGKKNTIKAAENTMFAGMEKVFAGGDVRRGPATAVQALADGKVACENIDSYLQGKGIANPKYIFNSHRAKKIADINKELYADYEVKPRVPINELASDKAKTTFSEVEYGYTEEEAIAEAERCLECGCKVNETCSLRKYATEYNVTQDVFNGMMNEHPIDDSHQFILRDVNKCIKCGKCVRTCAEIQGAGVLGYIYRGFKSYVAPDFGLSLNYTTCESCGKCIAVCPTGALFAKNVNYKQNPLECEKTIQSCGLCGAGCDILVDVHTDKVTKIQTPYEVPEEILPEPYDKTKSFNGRNLCYRGRFGWQKVYNKPASPMYKTGNKWETMIYAELKGKFSEIKDHGFNLYLSPNLSIEEMLVGKEISNNESVAVDWLEELDSYHNSIITKNFTVVNQERFETAENYVIVGGISQTIRTLTRLQQRKDKRMILVDYPENATFDRFTTERYKSLVEIKDFPKEKTIFIYNIDNISLEQAKGIKIYAETLNDFNDGSYIFVTSKWNNLRSIPFMDLPQDTLDKKVDIYFGDLPASYKRHRFTILISDVFNKDYDIDIYVPKSSYLEMNGVALADDYRVKVFSNPTNSIVNDLLINALVESQLLPISMAEMSNWSNRAELFLESLEVTNDIEADMHGVKTPRIITYRDKMINS